MSPRAPAASATPWSATALEPITLIFGPEEYLATYASTAIKKKWREQGEGDEHRISAANYSAGELTTVSSPSLFSSRILLDINELHSMSDDFLTDVLAYLSQPAPDVTVIMRHGGGSRGKKLVDAIKARDAQVVQVPAVKKDSEKLDILATMLKASRRSMEPEAGVALVNATGSSLADLGAAMTQLLADVSGTITRDHVDEYYGGREEATAFRVADAAVSGHRAQAMSAVRNALESGVDPVPIVAALASKMRQVASVYEMDGPSGGLASSLGMAPWQVDQARGQARRFTTLGMKRAFAALAQADLDVKGGARDPVYALERCILAISAKN